MRGWQAAWRALVAGTVLAAGLAAATPGRAQQAPMPTPAPVQEKVLKAQPVPPGGEGLAKPAAAPAVPVTPESQFVTEAVASAAAVLGVINLVLPATGLGSVVSLNPLLLPSLAGAIAAAAVARDRGWDELERVGAFLAGAVGGGVVGMASLGVISGTALRNLAGIVAGIAFAADRAVQRQEAALPAAATLPPPPSR